MSAARHINITAEARVHECLERIDAREAEIGAWETIDREGALEQARICDRSPDRGLLHGIPIGVKDIIDVAGLPARYGTPIYASNVAASDAACVALAKAAGAIVLGKTVTTELAFFHPGKTRNPHNLAHTPGGSSSGSAAAVAAGMVAFALGSQTAGSVIRPASFCGVVGYKPTFGMIPKSGVKPQSDTLDTVGLMAGSVKDVALFAAGITGDHDLLVPAASRQAARIGVCHTHEWDQASEDSQRAIETAAASFSGAGAKMTQVELPMPFARLCAAQKDIQLFECARSYCFEYEIHRGELSARLRALIEEGRGISWKRYRAALDLAAQCRALIAGVFWNIDVLLMPSAPGEAPHGLESTGDPVFNRIGTVLHLPCITLPGLRGHNGLPIGIQLMGPVWQDAATLSAAHWAHQSLQQ
jgi:Asp-tRNA(Asn)/Glu-tRNA(Gln) amidotransferase A subunit family amidase